MSVIKRLSSSLGRRDEVPNQELARVLYQTKNKDDIDELVRNLSHKRKAIQGDCIKVLYEVGYLRPELISPYVDRFVKLLLSRNNRLVWGAMIALSTIACIEHRKIYDSLELLFRAIEKGSVITVDNGISVLAKVSSANEQYEIKIVPYLLERLKNCGPKEIAQYAERSLVAVNVRNKGDFVKVLLDRMDKLSPSQGAEIQKVLKTIDKIE